MAQEILKSHNLTLTDLSHNCSLWTLLALFGATFLEAVQENKRIPFISVRVVVRHYIHPTHRCNFRMTLNDLE